MLKINCVWEHNGEDSLLYCDTFPGAFTRGASREEALRKMSGEVSSFLCWMGEVPPPSIEIAVIQEKACELNIRDADSDVLFDSETAPLTREEYDRLKALTLRSAADFHALYQAMPDRNRSCLPQRRTFYGQMPRTAEEMYRHTKSVNSYYFAEIGVEANNEGTILECRSRGFAALEQMPDFLTMLPCVGSYGELWSVRKVLRRFLWHDRIHARAMYRMARKTFPDTEIPNIFRFTEKEA